MRLLMTAALALVGCATGGERLRDRATDPAAAGMAVIDASGVVSRPLAEQVEQALSWWCERYPARCSDIRVFVAKGSIIVVDGCPMMSDPWYPPQRKVWGESRDNIVRVCWDRASDSAPGLGHELGHVAAAVLYRERAGVEDHAWMSQLRYPWLQ